MKKIILLLLALIFCVGTAATKVEGQWYGNRVWHVGDTLLVKLICADSSKHLIRVRAGDTLQVPIMDTKVIYAETLFTADMNDWATTHAESLSSFIIVMDKGDIDTIGAAFGDTLVATDTTSYHHEVGLSVKTIGTWGKSLMQLDAKGRWSTAAYQWNANPMGRNWHYISGLDSIPFWEMGQFKNGTDEVLAIQRKAGGALIGDPGGTSYNRTFLLFQNDETVSFSKFRNYDTTFAMKPIYRGIPGSVTAKDSLPTLGQVQKQIGDTSAILRALIVSGSEDSTFDSLYTKNGWARTFGIDTIREKTNGFVIVAPKRGMSPETAAVAVRTTGLKGISIVTIEGTEDSSQAHLWFNAKDGVWPFYSLAQFYADNGDMTFALQRKGILPSNTYFEARGDSFIVDTLRVRGEGSFDNKFYHKVETPDSNVATYGGVKSIVHDTMVVFRNELFGSDSGSVHHDNGYFWRYMVNYSKMDNADTSITWFPQVAKPFTDSSKNAPAVGAGNLWNSVGFMADTNRLVRIYDRDFYGLNFSFATFFKHDTSVAWRWIVYARDNQNIGSSELRGGWSIRVNNGEARFTIGEHISPASAVLSKNYMDNAWHFIAAACDSASKIISLQVDNDYTETNFTSNNIDKLYTLDNSSYPQPMYIGWYPGTDYPHNFGGYIDDWCYFGCSTDAALDRYQIDILRNWLYGTVFNTNVK